MPELMAIAAVGFGVTGASHVLADLLAPWIEQSAPGLARLSLTSQFLWLVVIATSGRTAALLHESAGTRRRRRIEGCVGHAVRSGGEHRHGHGHRRRCRSPRALCGRGTLDGDPRRSDAGGREGHQGTDVPISPWAARRTSVEPPPHRWWRRRFIRALRRSASSWPYSATPVGTFGAWLCGQLMRVVVSG